jgi:hypothetical protein
MMSWRNPDSRHAGWDFDTTDSYLAAEGAAGPEP